MKKLWLGFMLLTLVSCAFDKEPSTTDIGEIRDNQKIDANHALIVGTYTGTMTTPSRQHEIELNLFSLSIRDGENSKGLPKYRKELRGLYKKINPVGPDVTFEARFFAEEGLLVLTPTVAPTGADDIVSINARLVGQRLSGKVSSISGEAGFLDVSLSSKQQDIPDQGAENDYNERLRRQYEEISGTYQGYVIPPPEENAPFAITIKLTVTVTESGVPVISGELSYPFESSMDMILTAHYRPDFNPPKLTLKGKQKSRGSGNNPDYTATFDGVIQNGKFVGSMSSSNRVEEGHFTLEKN